MTHRPRQTKISRSLRALLDFSVVAPAAQPDSHVTTVEETRNKSRTTVRCGSCKATTTYPALFSQGPRGSMRLQSCPECKARYFKEGVAVSC
jgi:coenzyme F420-reducing hydrogenase gamma subunit